MAEYRYMLGNSEVKVTKDYYGQWNVWHTDCCAPKFAGPFRTKADAVNKIEQWNEDRK